jgi:hypothetical protein
VLTQRKPLLNAGGRVADTAAELYETRPVSRSVRLPLAPAPPLSERAFADTAELGELTRRVVLFNEHGVGLLEVKPIHARA